VTRAGRLAIYDRALMTAVTRERPDRVRAALRRHGLLRRPRALRLFLQRHGVRYTDGNRLSVFATGDEGLAAMLHAIERARRRIHLETYILRGDATGRRFIDALVAKARAGVTVRLLYDAVGSLSLDPALLTPLHLAGGQTLAFNPLRRLYPRWLPRRRDHRKILVVDGTVGFTGGLNIGDEYNVGRGGTGTPWRDTHVQLEGPAVQDLEAVFLESWFRADGPDMPWAQVLGSVPAPRGDERVAVVADGPSYRRRVMRDLISFALHTGREHVRLASPYLAPDGKIMGALCHAARRGTCVSLLLAGHTDHPILRLAAAAAGQRRGRLRASPRHAARQDHGHRSALGRGRHFQPRPAELRAQLRGEPRRRARHPPRGAHRALRSRCRRGDAHRCRPAGAARGAGTRRRSPLRVGAVGGVKDFKTTDEH
jgi:cardiolipin synthase